MGRRSALTFNDETRQYNALLQMTRMYSADRFMDLVYNYPDGANNGQLSSATVAGTGGAVYQDQRYGTFSYSFAVANGSYRVRLKFAELYYGNQGARVFHVDLNGTRVLTNFDVYLAASGQNQGVDREFAVTVTGGQVNLTFTAVTDNPIVNGIEIVGAAGSGFTPIRVNAGGGAYTDDRGVVWSADSGYSGGDTYGTAATVGGETVNYTYDSLARLSTAAIAGTSGWGLSWSYDGWGNRLAQSVTKGSGPTTALTVDAATNRISTASGWGYDNNGNATQAGAGMALTYDLENRLLTAAGEQYGYAPDNKRMYRKSASGTEKVTFWLGDRMLARYVVGASSLTLDATWRYFGRRNLSVVPDRVGSNVAGGKKYFPWGEEVAVSAGEDFKFGTYWRDSTGLDYADQRYYSGSVGRFLTGDPYVASAGVESPGSWNRYGYVEGDPVNFNDPLGLAQCGVTITNWDIFGEPSTTSDVGPCPTLRGDLQLVSTGTSARQANYREYLSDHATEIIKQRNSNVTYEQVVNQAERALSKSNCAGLFGSSADMASSKWNPLAAFKRWVAGTDPSFGTVAMVPSLLGMAALTEPFFGMDPVGFGLLGAPRISSVTLISASIWNESGKGFNVVTLLHEFGHAYGFASFNPNGPHGTLIQFDGLGTNAAQTSQANDQLIRKNCLGVN